MDNSEKEQHSDLELLTEFEKAFTVNSEGEGVINIDTKSVTIGGLGKVKSSSLSASGDAPIDFELEIKVEVKMVDTLTPTENTSEPILLQSGSRDAGLTELFKKRFPDIRDEAQLTTLLFEAAATFPIVQRNTYHEMYWHALNNYLAPAERKRIEDMRLNPQGIKLEDVKLRQDLYQYTKELAILAGKTEDKFLENLQNELVSSEFLGGQWIVNDEYEGPMIVVSKTVTRYGEGENPKLEYKGIWLRSREDAESGICEKAKKLGYKIGSYWDFSLHNSLDFVGIVIPKYEVFTEEEKIQTIRKIREMATKLGLEEIYSEPEPIQEEFGGGNTRRYKHA